LGIEEYSRHAEWKNRQELIDAGFTRRDFLKMGLLTAAG
jgi:hypothetical protein